MRAYVAVTDDNWYHFLAERPAIGEVNFWRPGGGREFRALAPGEPFFFKTHHPHDRVVGGGFYSGFAALRLSEAWDLYGAANGVGGLAEMRTRVARYRAGGLGAEEDPVIGCIFLRDTAFFPPDLLAFAPPDFARNVVQGKSYDLSSPAHAGYFRDLLERLLGVPVEIDLRQPWHLLGPVYGDPRLAPHRLGQLAFRGVVLQAYQARCAVTGDRIRPVLQAAHIRPLPAGGEHRLDNGLLLRSDVHTLFDRGYLGVDRHYRLLVSDRLRAEFGNGEEFYARRNQPIALPRHRADRPNPEFLEWHLAEVYHGS